MAFFMIRVFWIRIRLDDAKDNREFFGKYDIFFRDFNDDKRSLFFYPLFIIRRFAIVVASQIGIDKVIQLSIVISFHFIVGFI